MKKQWLVIAGLVALEQAVKVLIWNYAMDARVALIPNVLRFEPFQNTNLNWFASMADVVMPIFLMVILQAAAVVGLTLFYRYRRFLAATSTRWLSLGFCMAAAGIACSFIDVVFWGGSLDYIGFLNWFIFDMKDVFLHAGWIGIVVWFAFKADKSGKTEMPFGSWLKNGCKLT
jgi:signal peptidase II